MELGYNCSPSLASLHRCLTSKSRDTANPNIGLGETHELERYPGLPQRKLWSHTSRELCTQGNSPRNEKIRDMKRRITTKTRQINMEISDE